MADGQHLFVSYAHQDHAWAQAACAALEADGHACWIAPRDMRAGLSWPEQIVDAIRGARLMVLVLSEHANRSPQVLREVDRAVNHRVDVLVLRIGEFVLSGNLEYYISTCHWLEAGADRDSAILRLRIETRRILAGGGQSAAGRDPATAPVGAKVAKPARFEAAVLQRLEAELASFLGPIARHLVRRAAARSASLAELQTALAAELETESEREGFLAACRNARG
jgi:hypothetical protein